MKKTRMLSLVGLLLLIIFLFSIPFATATSPQARTTVSQNPLGYQANPAGAVAKWEKVEITLNGPDSVGMSDSQNPFLIDVSVIFTAPSGGSFIVPAFYDGDGSGGMDGNVWRVRFSPDETGNWLYMSNSNDPVLDGQSGSFDVVQPGGCTPYSPGALPDFSCVGRLEYGGGHFLKFADGPFWLKGGEDDPEDFLAPGQTAGFPSKTAAIDYLAGHGVNSLYIMLHNAGGDENNVWPWVGATPAQAMQNHEHFDLGKLQEWETLFTYIQNKGIVLHLVFEDDSGWNGFNRTLYYREMVARFGHHNGLYWNLSEEYNESYTANEIKAFAQLMSDIDSYGHPLTVHHAGSLTNWQAFVGDPHFDLTSFQTSLSPQNASAISWINLTAASGRPLPIAFDETGKIGAGNRDLARHIVWSVYLGGGNFEMHTSPLASYTDFADHFADMQRARTFMELMPFSEMLPANSLVSGATAYLLTKPGQVYAAYLPQGGAILLDLSGTSSTFDAIWFNPRSGATQSAGAVSGGAIRTFSAPDNNDWALRLETGGGDGGNVAPFANNSSVSTIIDTPVSLSLSYVDGDGPGPYTFTIVDGPDHGILSGSGADRTYTPNAGFSGADSFSWRVNDGLADSNVATVTLQVNVDGGGENQPPVAQSQTVFTQPGIPLPIQLQYVDPDSAPGPYTVSVRRDPAHGSLSGSGNDLLYTPDPGFSGTDSFTWLVNDGASNSNFATITVHVLLLDNALWLPMLSGYP